MECILSLLLISLLILTYNLLFYKKLLLLIVLPSLSSHFLITPTPLNNLMRSVFSRIISIGFGGRDQVSQSKGSPHQLLRPIAMLLRS